MNFKQSEARGSLWINPQQANGKRSFHDQQFTLEAVFDLKGEAYFKIGTLSAQKYDDYQGFANLVRQALEEGDQASTSSPNPIQPIYLVMDPSIVHSPEKLRRYRRLTRGKVMVLPQFSSQLNPIEEWFHKLRVTILSKAYSSNAQLCQGVHQILKDSQKFDFKAIIQEAISQIRRGEQRLPF
jgi:transposase